RPQACELLSAELGQFGKQIFELRSAHAQFSSENLESSTKPILFANRAQTRYEFFGPAAALN
ncbi:MAG: hypothetical protein Q8M78_11435, partial [Burkholderiaceae bacterium]|nr:hypothetical protein [Burkholderiaceae bacterium]